jgi:hypothetical protein
MGSELRANSQSHDFAAHYRTTRFSGRVTDLYVQLNAGNFLEDNFSGTYAIAR